MKLAFVALLALAVLAQAPAAVAQDTVEEIVVTGSRVTDFDALRTPMITLPKRADNLITTLTVSCDTRDESQRKAELKATLRNLIKAAAADPRIELGIGDEVVGKFDETMLDAVIARSQKVDTSVANVIIKTPVSPADTFDSATVRVEAFAKATPVVGRAELLLDKDWQLTLIGPNNYRPQIVKLIAEDARRSAEVFGPGYGAAITGLQLPVSWYQSGPLDLALYIPYTMVIAPRP